MNFSRFVALILAILVSTVTADSVAATVVQSTAFTYQGQLNAGGALPAGQTFQFTFTLYDAPTVGNVIGTPIKQPLLVGNGGLFTTDLDFGQIFNGTQYWLDIQVGTTTLNEQALASRQPINAVPVAQFALNTPPGTFAEFYHTYEDGFTVSVFPGDPIPFTNAGPASGSVIIPIEELIFPVSGPPYLADVGFQVPLSGIYEVSFEVTTEDAGGDALALAVNGFNVPHTQISPGSKVQAGKFLVTLYAGDVISLVNIDPSGFLNLGGFKIGTTDANLVIKLLH